MKQLAAVLLVILGGTLAHAAEGDLTPHRKDTVGNTFGFVEVLPPGYGADPNKRWPTLMFLPGLGEVGDSATDQALVDKMTAHGPCKLIKNGSTIFADAGILVLCIQSSDQVLGGGTTLMNDEARRLFELYRIDPDRFYFTGLSSGGGGVWRWGADLQGGHRLAAQINACGNSDAYTTSEFDTVPTFLVQSWGDTTNSRLRPIGWANLIGDHIAGTDLPDVMTGYPNVGGDPNAAAASDMTAKLTAAGWVWVTGRDTTNDAQLRLTLYTDGSHDSWTRTYDDATVWAWMFAQHRAGLPGQPDGAIILDNLDPGTTFTGSWSRVDTGSGFWGWDMHVATGSGSATFTSSTVPPGDYEVFLSWVPGADRAAAVPVNITSAGGTTTVMVDMRSGNGFTSLGTFTFSGTATVSIAAGGGTVIADAVALQIVGGPSLPDAGPVLEDDGGFSDHDAGGPGADDASGSCGCAVGGAGRKLPLGGLALGLLVLALRRRRR